MFRGNTSSIVILCVTVVMAIGALSLARSHAAGNPEWEKTVNAASKEGKLVVFGPAGELLRNALAGAFGKSHPNIAFEYAGGRAAEQAMRLKAERDGGVFSVDVFIGGSVTMMELGSYGALDPIESALILPQVKEPKFWRDGRLEFTNPATRFTLVFSSQPNPPVIYDPKQVNVSEIDELYELVDRKWKGKFVLNDPLPAGPGGSMFRWLWRILGPDKASDYFRAIRAQAGAVDRDQRRQIEWIAQGKYRWLFAPTPHRRPVLVALGDARSPDQPGATLDRLGLRRLYETCVRNRRAFDHRYRYQRDATRNPDYQSGRAADRNRT